MLPRLKDSAYAFASTPPLAAPQPHASPQRHSGPHAHAVGATASWQPHAQLDPAQGLQPQAFVISSFMAFSFGSEVLSASSL